MVNIYDPLHAASEPVFPPQHLIDRLAQIQVQWPNQASSSIYIYDLIDQHTLCASYPIAAILGYTAETIHTMGPVGLAHLIHPDDLARVAEHYQRFATLQYGDVISVDYRMQRADGTWCWLRSQETSLIQASDGFPLQILGMLQTIAQPTVVPKASTRAGRSLTRRFSWRRRRADCQQCYQATRRSPQTAS